MTLMVTATIKFRSLHAKQREIYDQLGHRNVLRCGRRLGKTALLETTFAKRAILGRKIGWFTPDYKIMRPSYSRLHKLLGGIVSHASKTESIIELKTGGLIEFWSLDNEDAGRSRDYDDAVVDEGSLIKKGLREIVEQAIMPTLLDRRGTMTMAGTPKGIDPENFFYTACHDKSLGWKEFHAPTRDNPMLDPVGVANLQNEYPPLVYQQEYLAEFVDWSGAAFFGLEQLLEDGAPVDAPIVCDAVLATIDSATKTGRDHDGTAVTYWAYKRYPTPRLWVLDWDIVQIEGSLLETWLPTVFQNLEAFAKSSGAAMGSLGAFIEDKSSGMVLLQQAARRGWPATAIDSKLTSVGKDERAISVSGYVYRGMVKLTTHAYEKTTNYKGQAANHFRKQVCGFRIGLKDLQDDLLDTFTYGIAITLGDSGGF